MFNEYELPVILNALDEYAKNNPENKVQHLIDSAKRKAVAFLDGDSIADIWSLEDVFGLMFPEDDLDRGHTEQEVATARKVLAQAVDHHNAEYGINWDSLQVEVDDLNERGLA